MDSYNVKIINFRPTYDARNHLVGLCFGDFVANNCSNYSNRCTDCRVYCKADGLEQARGIVRLFKRWCDEQHAFDEFYNADCNDCGVSWFLDPVTEANYYVVIGVFCENHSHLAALKELIATDWTIDADKIAKARAI